MKLNAEQIKNIGNNISRYLKKEYSLSERMSFCTDELASHIAFLMAKDAKRNGFFAEDSPLNAYLPSAFDSEEPPSEVIAENASVANAKFAAAHSAYLADLCKKITVKLREHSKLKISPALFADTGKIKEAAGRVAFSESHVLTNAFEQFRKSNKLLSPSYVRSFADACEDVSSGASEWCILPIENNREGALISVYNLIERFELCISKVCSISSEELTTKFALLCSGVHGIIDIQGKQNVVLRMPVRDSVTWSRIFTGASLSGASLVKTVALPLGYTDGYAHICTFFGEGEDLFAFLLFLQTLRIDFTLMGAYE